MSIEKRRAVFNLIIASFLVLFQELILIRWLGAQVRALAYFPNLVLISAFLGLGLGCLYSQKKSLLWLWPISFFILTITHFLLGKVIFTSQGLNEQLWLLYYDMPESSPVISSLKLPIFLSFILTAISFIPLGQLVGSEIQFQKNQNKPLMGYIYNIAGSLLGIIAFSLIGFSGLFPVYWFGILFALGMPLFIPHKKKTVLYIIFSFFTLFIVVRSEKSISYSPYYALSYKDKGSSFEVMTNGSLHQIALDLLNESQDNEYLKIVQRGYSHPYSLIKKQLNQVLVLGAGTGNDVATLLKYEKVRQIDVIEIDPVILKWGMKHHPNSPYSSEKVNLINTDARSFLNNTNKTYDLIVFGTLDSQTRLSALSNVRLDNYVYTLEALQSVKKHLSPEGGMVMYFMIEKEYILEKLFAMVTKVFGEVPNFYSNDHKLFNVILMAGKLFESKNNVTIQKFNEAFKDKVMPYVEIPSDDWPFLYLENRKIDSFYLHTIIFVLFISFLAILLFSKRNFFSLKTIDYEMFFFGLGFLLLETRSITQMNLVWGATWLTSAAVFGAVLGMVLLAILIVKKFHISITVAFIGLFLSLTAVYLIPTAFYLQNSLMVKLIFSIAIIGSPIFFASLCFSKVFADRESTDLAFGWNLFGSVCGGLLEFFSIVFGLKTLLLMAAIAYLFALLFFQKRKKLIP